MRTIRILTAFLASLVSSLPLAASNAAGIGISVSAPKVYEERTLRAMLAEAESQLANIHPISGAKIEQAIGSIQGQSQVSTGFSLTAQGVAQPAIETTEEQTLNSSGQLGTSKVTEKTTREKESATVPSEPTPPTLSTTGFGLSSRDLLAEQTALAYQIASLRLALERATSDRLNSLPDANGTSIRPVPRYPIVLGFTIGIDRPIKNSVAEVDITLDLTGSETSALATPAPPGMSLVAVLPTREAFNVAAITDSQTSIGAGQVVSVIQLGARFLRSRKTYYIVRDIDTIATLRSPTAAANQIKVGWQFRPVLGRKTVDPGPRQVFVVLAVDDQRYAVDLKLSAEASVRWSRINKDGVLAVPELSSPAVIPLGKVGYWQIFTKEQLAPFPSNPKLTLLSAERALVSLGGSFLSAESKVLVGDTTIDRANGLAFSDETGLSFVIPLKDLGRASDVYLVNRFLEPTPIRRDPLNPPGVNRLMLLGSNCSEKRPPGEDGCCFAQQLSGTDRYRIVADLTSDKLPDLPDLIAIAGDTVVTGAAAAGRNGGSAIRLFSTDPSPTQRSVVFDLPAEAIRKNPELTIREVFGGPERAVRCRLPILPFIERVSVVSRNKTSATLALQGRGLKAIDAVFVGDEWLSFSSLSETIAVFQVSWEKLVGVESLLVRSGREIQQIVSLKEKVELKKPAFSTKPEVAEGFSGSIELEGENLESIRKISFEGLELRRQVDGKKLTIFLVTQVTAKAAPRALTIELIDGSEILLPVIVKAAGG